MERATTAGSVSVPISYLLKYGSSIIQYVMVTMPFGQRSNVGFLYIPCHLRLAPYPTTRTAHPKPLSPSIL
jgi:hypothetical protein